MNEKPGGISKYPAGTNWHEINQRITNSEDKIKMLEALLKESNGDEFIYLKGGQKFTNQEQKLKELYTSSEIEEELNERTRALIDKYKQRIEELEAKCEKLKKKKKLPEPEFNKKCAAWLGIDLCLDNAHELESHYKFYLSL